MIEATIISYLSGVLTVPVLMEIPKEMPETFVVLEKTGGGMENHIFSATIAIQSYAPTMYAAATLNEEIKGALLYGRVPDEITRVSLNSDYNYTDPDLNRYRYQAVYDINHY